MNTPVHANANTHWGWNAAVVLSFIFLVYLPAQEIFLEREVEGGYLALLKILPTGIGYTLAVTLMGSVAAIAVGLLVGLAKLSRNKLVLMAASLYTEILRGIPLLVLLFYIYYALGEFFNIHKLAAAVLGFGFCYGAYMNERQAMFQIILPQAMRTIVPAVGNQTLGMLKDTSLVSVLAISDILRVANEYATRHFNYFETYTYIALTYLALTLLLSKGVTWLENRSRIV